MVYICLGHTSAHRAHLDPGANGVDTFAAENVLSFPATNRQLTRLHSRRGNLQDMLAGQSILVYHDLPVTVCCSLLDKLMTCVLISYCTCSQQTDEL